MSSEIWIGLFKVYPLEGHDPFGDPDLAAFVTVVALASNEEHYFFLVEDALLNHSLEVVDYEDVEPLASRCSRTVVIGEIQTLVENLSFGEANVLFSTFDVFPISDEDEG